LASPNLTPTAKDLQMALRLADAMGAWLAIFEWLIMRVIHTFAIVFRQKFMNTQIASDDERLNRERTGAAEDRRQAHQNGKSQISTNKL
jgi:hypothetical protein